MNDWIDEPDEMTDDDFEAMLRDHALACAEAWDARDAQIAFIIRASIEDAALATISPWSAEPPY